MWARHGRSYDESDYLINLSEDANIIRDGKGVHRTKSFFIYFGQSRSYINLIISLLHKFCFTNVPKLY